MTAVGVAPLNSAGRGGIPAGLSKGELRRETLALAGRAGHRLHEAEAREIVNRFCGRGGRTVAQLRGWLAFELPKIGGFDPTGETAVRRVMRGER